MKVTRKGIAFPRRLAGRAVSIEFDGRRVWSVTLEGTAHRNTVTWPKVLLDRLHGSSWCRIIDGDDELWAGRVVWGGDGMPDLVDAAGRPLVLNKWGAMRPSFERDPSIRERVAESADEMLAVLRSFGFDAFVVGGTLLGAVRDGAILPHDDDADLAYLSHHSHPSDLVLENHRLARRLEDLGYRVRRHSWAHLQVLKGEPGSIEYYVDIFTAFYQGDVFNEPIHVREPQMAGAILPLAEVELQGRALPAPRDADAWLRACYGPHWRTPDPSFAFDTPLGTRRRFDAWFSSYNMGRSAWEERYADGLTGSESVLIRRHVIKAGDTVLDLGSGGGDDLAAYRSAGLAATGCDYAMTSPAVEAGEPLVNLVEYVAAVEFAAAWMRSLPTGAKPVLAANHLLACQDPRGRGVILSVFGMALRAGARVISADYEDLGAYAFDAPRTWHLPPGTLTDEALRAGLTWRLVETGGRADEDGIRRALSVIEFELAEANERAPR